MTQNLVSQPELKPFKLDFDLDNFDFLELDSKDEEFFKAIEEKAENVDKDFDDFMQKYHELDKTFVNLFDVDVMEQRCSWVNSSVQRTDLKYPERLKIMAVYLKKNQGSVERLYEIALKHRCRTEFKKMIDYSISKKSFYGVSCEAIMKLGLCNNKQCYEMLKKRFGKPFPQDVCRL